MTARLRRSLVAVFAAVVAIAGGCGGGNNASDGGPGGMFMTMGMPGVPSPTRIGSNLVFADVSVDGKTGGRLGVDTGAPVVVIDSSKYPGLTFPDQPTVTGDLQVGELTINNVPIVPMSFSGTMDPLNFAGLLGGQLMRQFAARLDYANPNTALRLGTPPMEMATDGVEMPGTTADFTLQGGGLGKLPNGDIISFPATRIPLQVDVEGTTHPFILDTGASETTVRTSLFTTVTADGRAQLSGLPITTVMGATSATVTRVRSLTVAGQTVTSPVVMTIGDTLLDGIEMEVNHPVDGLLGGNFLREFLVTVDYPEGLLRLQRYTTPPIADEFKRIGVELGLSGGTHRYAVAKVYPNTDAAAKQLNVGDELVSVDGQALDALDAGGADAALNGSVGSMKMIEFGNATLAIVRNMIVAIRVDDLIPAPAP
jgi:hypothetical protein